MNTPKIPGTVIAYGVGIILILVMVIFIGGALKDAIRKMFGLSEEPVEPPKDVELPGVSLGVNNPFTPEQSRNIRAIARRIHTDVDGLAYPGSRDKEAYATLLEFDDQEFVACYNDFNALYYSEGEGNMRERIDDEIFGYTFSIFTPWGIYDGTQTKNAIMERMDNLNLN